MQNTNTEKTNVPDNRGREENQTTKLDTDEVSGSSDCSFFFPAKKAPPRIASDDRTVFTFADATLTLKDGKPPETFIFDDEALEMMITTKNGFFRGKITAS